MSSKNKSKKRGASTVESPEQSNVVPVEVEVTNDGTGEVGSLHVDADAASFQDDVEIGEPQSIEKNVEIGEPQSIKKDEIGQVPEETTESLTFAPVTDHIFDEGGLTTARDLETVVGQVPIAAAEAVAPVTEMADLNDPQTVATVDEAIKGSNDLTEGYSVVKMDTTESNTATETVTPNEVPAEASTQPAEQVAPAEAPVPTLSITEQIALMKAKIANATSRGGGSKPRANVIYTLLAKPTQLHKTPQVAQLHEIIFEPTFVDAHRGPDGVVKVSEAELFAQVQRGKEAGILRTKQDAHRILQYYRPQLIDCIRWQ